MIFSTRILTELNKILLADWLNLELEIIDRLTVLKLIIS
jgi:hypothetical protein